MSFNESNLHIIVDELKKENEELKSLVKDLINACCHSCYPWSPWFKCEHFNGSECELTEKAEKFIDFDFNNTCNNRSM